VRSIHRACFPSWRAGRSLRHLRPRSGRGAPQSLGALRPRPRNSTRPKRPRLASVRSAPVRKELLGARATPRSNRRSAAGTGCVPNQVPDFPPCAIATELCPPGAIRRSQSEQSSLRGRRPPGRGRSTRDNHRPRMSGRAAFEQAGRERGGANERLRVRPPQKSPKGMAAEMS